MWSVIRPAQTQEVPSLAFVKAIHSSGASQRIRVITGAAEPAAPAESADVVILAPAWPLQSGRRSLEQLVEEAVAAMAPGAIVYAMTPRRIRPRILQLLWRHGLEFKAPTLHLRSGAARYYVPLTPTSLSFALHSWPLPRRWRPIPRLLRALPGSSRILAWLLPTVGFAAQRQSESAFSWLLSRLPNPARGEALVATSWRVTEASALVFGIARRHGVPLVVAKQAPHSKRRSAQHEASMLRDVAPNAEAAGVGVPHLIELIDSPAQTYLLETGVGGTRVSLILEARPAQLASTVKRLSSWLEAWHRNSIQRSALTEAACEDMILGPARSLVDSIHFGPEYLDWLHDACRRLIGTEVPWVNTHNDLTMANVLQRRDGGISVVDWEAARARGLPLADFWYAACDAATASDSRDRAAMFNHCFLEGGDLNAMLEPHEQRLRATVSGPDAWIELCFHGCWLQHAANEQAQRAYDEASPFLAIVNALAASALESGRPARLAAQ